MYKYSYNKQGSIFFIMILFLMIITITLYSFMRTCSYIMSLAHEREKSEKHYYLAYSLYCFIKTMYSEQCKNAFHKTIIFQGPWPDQNALYKGKAWIEIKKNIKILFVRLDNNKQHLIILSFII